MHTSCVSSSEEESLLHWSRASSCLICTSRLCSGRGSPARCRAKSRRRVSLAVRRCPRCVTLCMSEAASAVRAWACSAARAAACCCRAARSSVKRRCLRFWALVRDCWGMGVGWGTARLRLAGKRRALLSSNAALRGSAPAIGALCGMCGMTLDSHCVLVCLCIVRIQRRPYECLRVCGLDVGFLAA